jgi:putative tryptophan/tyrosine transport system substrate-binding protein
MSGKWAELLKQIAPNVTRALVFRDPTSAAGIGQFAAVRSVAQSIGVELTPVDVRDTDEIERVVAAFARPGNGGVIVPPGGTAARRKLIIGLAIEDAIDIPCGSPDRIERIGPVLPLRS